MLFLVHKMTSDLYTNHLRSVIQTCTSSHTVRSSQDHHSALPPSQSKLILECAIQWCQNMLQKQRAMRTSGFFSFLSLLPGDRSLESTGFHRIWRLCIAALSSTKCLLSHGSFSTVYHWPVSCFGENHPFKITKYMCNAILAFLIHNTITLLLYI